MVPDDWPRLRELRLKALAQDPLAFGSTLAREAVFDEPLWQERVRNSSSGSAQSTLVALAPGERWVGMITLHYVEGAWRVFGMWVDPVVRGRGVGGRLLDLGIAWAEDAHPGAGVELSVNPRQTFAVRLYERRGFRFTGQEEPLGHTPGEVARKMVRPPKSSSGTVPEGSRS